ncbi:hypothetical protein MTR67_034545 [Solanum verrucosum]|uniref:Uncharacterized protein n=1 Tax=Solanum verrucosum TaxID=315347 RepID=A0AAF0U8F9_SOLVR|nr:hypothetical protein MTR67_034545 [Solanum verrucosum]
MNLSPRTMRCDEASGDSPKRPLNDGNVWVSEIEFHSWRRFLRSKGVEDLSLDTFVDGVADQLILGGIMRQPFSVASTLLDYMTKLNQSCHTRKDNVSPFNVGLTKEQMEKNQECDENMAKMMAQMDLLTKHVIGGGSKVVNVVGASSEMMMHNLTPCIMKRYDSFEPSGGFSSELSQARLKSRIRGKKGSLPSDTIANLKNDNAQFVAILTRSVMVVGSDVPNDDNASPSKGKAIVFESDLHGEELNNEASNEVDDAPKNVFLVMLKSQMRGVVPPSVPPKPQPKAEVPVTFGGLRLIWRVAGSIWRR